VWLSITDELRIVGRLDVFDPNTYVDNDDNTLIIGAVDYMPTKDVHIMPNIHVQTYQADVASDVVGRVTFYYILR